MPKVAVLTVSKRTGWEHIAVRSLDRQTFQLFTWVVVREPYDEGCLGDAYGLPVPTIPAPAKKRVSNLNASLNEGLRHCLDVDYVVFYQDFIDLPEDCVEKLVEDAEMLGGAFVTTATINHDGTMDGRYTGLNDIRPCEPAEWEANVAIAPMKAIIELGGFDEEYDNGWSWDNVNLAERARLLGYKFYIDESIKPKLLYHPKEPEVNPNIKPNGDFHARVMQEIANGTRPLRLDYLKKVIEQK